jgi:hypothetical protein
MGITGKIFFMGIGNDSFILYHQKKQGFEDLYQFSQCSVGSSFKEFDSTAIGMAFA